MRQFLIILSVSLVTAVLSGDSFAQYGSSGTAIDSYGTGMGTSSSAIESFGTGIGSERAAIDSYGTGIGSSGSAIPSYGTGLGSAGTAAGPSGIAMKIVGSKNMVRGRVGNIDAIKNEIVLEALTTGRALTFIVSPSQLEYLTVGERVRVEFDPKTNVAEKINSTVFKKGRWWYNDKE